MGERPSAERGRTSSTIQTSKSVNHLILESCAKRKAHDAADVSAKASRLFKQQCVEGVEYPRKMRYRVTHTRPS